MISIMSIEFYGKKEYIVEKCNIIIE